MTTPQLGLEFMAEGTSPHHIFDRLIQKLDTLVMLAIEDRDLNSPPAAVSGEIWLVKSLGSGAWTFHTGDLAIYYPSFDPSPNFDFQGPWYFVTPYDGMRIRVKDEDIFLTRKNGAWFAGATIANPTTTLTTMTTALNAIIAALEGHGFLDE